MSPQDNVNRTVTLACALKLPQLIFVLDGSFAQPNPVPVQRNHNRRKNVTKRKRRGLSAAPFKLLV